MPIRKVKKPGTHKTGFQWGKHGKIYSTRIKAIRQMKAAFANGYKGK